MYLTGEDYEQAAVYFQRAGAQSHDAAVRLAREELTPAVLKQLQELHEETAHCAFWQASTQARAFLHLARSITITNFLPGIPC